jgi:hypothetical protein
MTVIKNKIQPLPSFEVWYDDISIITSTEYVDMNHCSSCTFTNAGNDDATLMKNTPLAQGQSVSFNNLPNEVMNKAMMLRFAGVGNAPNVVMIRKYVKQTA